MTPAEKGRFCSSCQKVVVDFTILSDAEIINYFKVYKTKACGRFTSNQLHRKMQLEKPYKSGFNYKFFTGISLLLGLSMPIMGHEYTQVNIKKEYVLDENTVIENNSLHDSLRTIRGKITDSLTMEPLIGAIVRVKGITRVVTTDLDGYFEIKVEGNNISNAVLSISYTGYETKEIKVPLSTNSLIEVQLSEAAIEIAGDVIIVTTTTLGAVSPDKEETFFEKIKRFFRSIF